MSEVVLYCSLERTTDMEYEYTMLSTIELLEKVVGPRAAKRLYRGSLQPLFEPSKALNRYHLRLAAARELVKRWLDEELKREFVLSNPQTVRDYLRLSFAGAQRESFVVLFLDNQNRLIAAEELFRGTLSQTAVYPREVVKRALEFNAAATIFAHNHPSGVAEPSRADEVLTQTLKQALALVDVRVIDHFVVAKTHAVSFAERGLI
jgi:DNA repair protein RadC